MQGRHANETYKGDTSIAIPVDYSNAEARPAPFPRLGLC